MTQRSRFFDSVGAPITLATSAAADDIIDTATPHGFVAGQAVHFTALTGGTGLSVGTIYWVTSTSLGATTFRVAASPGGANLGFSTDITAGTVVGGDRVYAASAIADVLSGIIGDGVVDDASPEMAVSESSPTAMSVRVNLGKAFIKGYFLEVYSAQEVLAIAAAHATLARIDRVVVRRDLAGRNMLLAVLTGTPAASPTVPALTQNDAGIWEISLAQVLVPAASSTVINANITDERGTRAHAPYIDSALAGALAPSSLLTPVLGAWGRIDLTGVTTPSQLTGNVDDYSPAGLSGTIVLRLASDADGREVRGIAAPSSGGRLLLLVNVNAGGGPQRNINLMEEAGTSAAANRILTRNGSSQALVKQSALLLWYDAIVSRWRVVLGL